MVPTQGFGCFSPIFLLVKSLCLIWLDPETTQGERYAIISHVQIWKRIYANSQPFAWMSSSEQCGSNWHWRVSDSENEWTWPIYRLMIQYPESWSTLHEGLGKTLVPIWGFPKIGVPMDLRILRVFRNPDIENPRRMLKSSVPSPESQENMRKKTLSDDILFIVGLDIIYPLVN